MCRYVFYFAVALLAFVAGSFVVSKFFRITEENHVYKEEIKSPVESLPENNVVMGFGQGSSESNLREFQYVPKLYKATCKNKKLMSLWRELKKDKAFKERENEFSQTGDCSDLIKVKKVDLNGDGQKEFVVWGRYTFSGVTGNSVIWIYEKKKGRYRKLLQSYAYKYGEEEEWFEAKKDASNGYRNLLLKIHYSGYETAHSYYKYNGEKYVENKCWFKVYSLHKETPIIMTCEEFRTKH